MTILDVESYKFSTHSADYVTYGRFVNISSAQTVIGTGAYGDPCMTWVGNYSNPNVRRMIKSGSLSVLYASGRHIIPLESQPQKIAAWDLVNSKEQAAVLFYGTTGMIGVEVGGTLIFQSGLGLFPVNAYFWYSIKFVIGASGSGVVGVNIGNINVLNLTGITTQATSRPYLDTTAYINAPGGNWSMQHMIWNDQNGTINNSYMPEQRVTGSVPVANGDVNNFTPNGLPAQWQNVANSPPVTGDFNSSSTVGAMELYKISPPAGAIGIAGAMVSLVNQKSDTGARSMAIALKSGGVVGLGATFVQPDSLLTESSIFETDPSTGVNFIPSALPNIQIGGKIIA